GIDGGKQADGHAVGPATGGPGGGVSPAELVCDASGPEPGGAGAPAGGEEQAAEQGGQAGGAARGPGSSQGRETTGEEGRKLREWHGWLLDTCRPPQASSCPRSRPSSPLLPHPPSSPPRSLPSIPPRLERYKKLPESATIEWALG